MSKEKLPWRKEKYNKVFSLETKYKEIRDTYICIVIVPTLCFTIKNKSTVV